VLAGSVLSTDEARWLALEAQGLGRPRPKRAPGRAALLGAIGGMGMVQLDAINVLERTQFVTLFSRLGAYDRSRFHTLSGPGRELFEYWGRVAALLPVERQPLFRWRMAKGTVHGEGSKWKAVMERWRADHADYLATVLAEVRERGPLSAGDLTDPRRRDGEWWGRRSVGRQALEDLALRGELVGWRSPSFERIYDVPERVLPAEVLAQPTPTTEGAHRELLQLAAGSLGVATGADLAAFYGLKVQRARPRLAELVEDGELVEVRVEGWKDRAYALPTAAPKRPRRTNATLLSPFDLLVWDRRRTRRLFDFDYTIEVYVPEPKRVFGYFVLPVLLGDQLVGRVDLKSDRKTSSLLVRGAFLEPGQPAAAVAAATAAELDAMRAWLGLDHVSITRRGNLSAALRKETSGRTR
jgi:uncharacterized protein YcaQ